MKDVERRIKNPVRLVVHLGAGIFATWRDCMLISRHPRFVGGKIDSFSSRELPIGVVDVFSGRILNEVMHIKGGEET